MKFSKKIISLFAVLAFVSCLGASLAVAENPDPNSFNSEVAEGATACADCGVADGHADGCSLNEAAAEVEAAEPTLFESLMAAEDIEGMHAVITAAPGEALNALTQDEIDALLDRVDALDPLCENPETEAIVDLLVSLPGFVSGAEQDGEEASAFAGTGDIADDFNFTSSHTINSAVTINNDDNGGEANWTFDGNYTVTINKTVTIPKGQSLDIIIGSKNASEDKVATIKAGSSLGDSPMFIVEGTLKIGYSYSQNYGKVRINGGTIQVNDGGRLYVGEIDSVRGDATWDLNGNGKLYVCGNVPVRGDLSIAGDGASKSVVQAISSGRTIAETKTGRELTANGKYMFRVYDGHSIKLENLTMDGGAEWSGAADYRVSRGTENLGLNCGFVRVDNQANKDEGYEFEANNCVFRDADYEGSVLLFYWKADSHFSGVTVQDCTDFGGDGLIRAGTPTGSETDTPATRRTFVMENSSIIRCMSLNAPGAGGVIRTNGTVEVAMTLDSITLDHNYSSGWGNILWNAKGSCTISNSTFTNNTAGRRGGAISSEGEGMTIANSTFTGNKAGEYGGAVCMFPYTLTGKDAGATELTMNVEFGGGCKFEGNEAPIGGAVAIMIQETKSELPTVLNASINLGEAGYMKNNEASQAGGAVFAGCTAANALPGTKINLTVNSGAISENSAPTGGAIFVNDVRTNNTSVNTVTVAGGVISKNGADNGGAIAVDAGNFIMTNGTISDNSASESGGAVSVSGGNVALSGGLLSSNDAATNGGAVSVSGGTFTMSGGSIANNTASNGGGAYVTGNGASMSVSNGALTGNIATQNGGAAYVDGGTFTLNSGSMSSNVAVTGGAAYVTGGNFVMYGGEVSFNTASNGGAAYVNDGNFDMISGKLLNNGTQSETAVTEYGGAVYVNGGDITVGVENCAGGDEGTKHTSTHTDKVHPIIKSNKSQYGGAFAIRGENAADGSATNGIVTVYCSYIKDNQADNEGTGHNIFMDGGSVTHYVNSAVIGEDENHEIVTIGGQLQVVKDGEIIEISLIYDSNASAINLQWKGQAPEGYHINLPYCPKDWQDIQAGNNKAFVGWSHVRTDSTLANEVRDKDDYLPIGKAIEIKGDSEKKMTFYAVWAPMYNQISYAYSLDGENVEQAAGASELGIVPVGDDDFSNYPYNNVSYDRGIPNPVMAGYKFTGWLVYADTNKISNWAADPVPAGTSSDSVALLSQIPQPSLWTGKIDRNFGDITLVAMFEPMYSDLTIKVENADSRDSNQSFLFVVRGTSDAGDAIELDVLVEGNGSTKVAKLPVGTYTVTGLEDWGWRYWDGEAFAERTVTLTSPANPVTAEFGQSRVNHLWLSGDDLAKNVFAAVEASVE